MGNRSGRRWGSQVDVLGMKLFPFIPTNPTRVFSLVKCIIEGLMPSITPGLAVLCKRVKKITGILFLDLQPYRCFTGVKCFRLKNLRVVKSDPIDRVLKDWIGFLRVAHG